MSSIGRTALAVVLLFTVAAPALGADESKRSFESDQWDRPPSKVEDVGEKLSLVDLRTLDLSRTIRRDNGYAGSALGVYIPTDGYRGFGPFDRLGPFHDATKAPNEVWYRYHVRLTSWNAASTGKLPGLAGIYGSSARGCIPPTETNRGWSARGMFDAPGTHGAPEGEVPIGTYLYHWAQEGTCGDGLWWGASLEQGRWHCVEGHVRLNSPGQSNGLFRGWLDGNQAIRKTGIEYRGPGQGDVGVRHMWHNVYFGGSWPTPNPLSLQYDEVVVSTDGRVGCMPPFSDIGQTVHAGSITELHALGYLFGCDYRKACPSQELSRGQAAAFISRVFRLPATSKDHFSDDNGSTFEGVINRLAEVGVTKGCNPPANTHFCPDETMTRAQFAVMLARALRLSGSAPNAFADDDGHWAENHINRFALAGITKGCASDRYCPEYALRRDEAASFFKRSLELLDPLSQASVEPPPDWPPSGDPPPTPPEEQD